MVVIRQVCSSDVHQISQADGPPVLLLGMHKHKFYNPVILLIGLKIHVTVYIYGNIFDRRAPLLTSVIPAPRNRMLQAV